MSEVLPKASTARQLTQKIIDAQNETYDVTKRRLINHINGAIERGEFLCNFPHASLSNKKL